MRVECIIHKPWLEEHRLQEHFFHAKDTIPACYDGWRKVLQKAEYENIKNWLK